MMGILNIRYVICLAVLPVLLTGLLPKLQAQDTVREYALPHDLPQPAAGYPDKDDRYDVTYYGLHLNLDPEKKRISGWVELHATIRRATGELEVDLHENFTIDSVSTASGSRVEPRRLASTPSWQVDMQLPRIYEQREQIVLNIYYQGQPPEESESFVFSQAGAHPAIWSLSEPFGAKEWFPVKDTPADKADSALVDVTVPAPLIAVSNGTRIDSSRVSGNRIRYVWITRYPIAHYLISVAAADYRTYTQWYEAEDRRLPITNYIYPDENLQAIRDSTAATVELMDLYSGLFGPYPFLNEKYGHAQFGWNGGMEHQTISSMGLFDRWIIAHELAHQWFGDAVTCSSWRDIWLNEGFATYAEGLAVEAFDGHDAFAQWIEDRFENITQSGEGTVRIPSGLIEEQSTASVNRIFDYRLTYLKGMAVLHMLRGVLGDEVFFDGIREYVQGPLRYGRASTADLREVLERTSGRRLDWFFDQWVEGAGHPNYRLTTRIHQHNGLYKISGQLKDLPTDTQSVPHFTMPVELQFSGQDLDTVVTVWHHQPEQDFEFTFGQRPTGVMLDPNHHILKGYVSYVGLGRGPGDELPHRTTLDHNYPNPFNPTTTIPVEVARSQHIRLDVFDINGRLVARLQDGPLPTGRHTFIWDAGQLAGGVYLIRLQAEDGSARIQKAVLLK